MNQHNRMENSFENRGSQSQKHPTNKSQNNKKYIKSKIIINVSDTQYAVVKQVSKKLRWNLTTDPMSNLNFDICWTDNHVRQQIFARMQQYQKINHFPGMSILSRKNNLGRNLMSFRRNFPGQYDFFPITWNLPTDYPDLKEYHENRKQGKAQTFIVKPQASCQGRGIYLTRNIERLKFDRCVVQRYMHKPYLIDNLKFDLRIYVLVSGIDPFRIFVYDEGLARFATEPYCAPRTDNLDNKFMHLTNYAINKDHPDFIFNQSIEKCDVGHKRSLTSLFKTLQEHGANVEELKNKIDDIFIKTLITGYPTLSRSLHQAHPDNFANDMSFEVLGFDIMLDNKLNPYLLQINYTPSFTTDTPLDTHIKKNLILDTIDLLNITNEWKTEMRNHKKSEIQYRMVSGKRKKYLPDQRIRLCHQAAKIRDNYQKQHMGNFRKIFMKQGGIGQYKKYYDYAEEIYLQEHNQNNYISNYSPLYRNYINNQRPRESVNKTIINTSQIQKENKTVTKKSRNVSSAKPSKDTTQDEKLIVQKLQKKNSAKILISTDFDGFQVKTYKPKHLFTNDKIKAKYMKASQPFLDHHKE